MGYGLRVVISKIEKVYLFDLIVSDAETIFAAHFWNRVSSRFFFKEKTTKKKHEKPTIYLIAEPRAKLPPKAAAKRLA